MPIGDPPNTLDYAPVEGRKSRTLLWLAGAAVVLGILIGLAAFRASVVVGVSGVGAKSPAGNSNSGAVIAPPNANP